MHKGYKCLHKASGRVYLARDVIFDEKRFPFSENPTQPSTCSIHVDTILLPSLQPTSEHNYAQHCPTEDFSEPTAAIPLLSDSSSAETFQSGGQNSNSAKDAKIFAAESSREGSAANLESEQVAHLQEGHGELNCRTTLRCLRYELMALFLILHCQLMLLVQNMQSSLKH